MVAGLLPLPAGAGPGRTHGAGRIADTELPAGIEPVRGDQDIAQWALGALTGLSMMAPGAVSEASEAAQVPERCALGLVPAGSKTCHPVHITSRDPAPLVVETLRLLWCLVDATRQASPSRARVGAPLPTLNERGRNNAFGGGASRWNTVRGRNKGRLQRAPDERQVSNPDPQGVNPKPTLWGCR